MIGHNRGPAFGPGRGFRTHAWKQARRALLPQMPLEIVRIRVKRAQELGLPYKTYATVRATTGRDIVAFLFSSNALRLVKPTDQIPPDRATRLRQIRHCRTTLGVLPPADPAGMGARLLSEGIEAASFRAPTLRHSWAETRDILKTALASQNLPADGVFVIGETMLEADWPAAANLAGYLPAAEYFSDPRP